MTPAIKQKAIAMPKISKVNPSDVKSYLQSVKLLFLSVFVRLKTNKSRNHFKDLCSQLDKRCQRMQRQRCAKSWPGTLQAVTSKSDKNAMLFQQNRRHIFAAFKLPKRTPEYSNHSLPASPKAL